MFKDKTLQKICFSKEFCTFLHFLQCKFTLRKNLKDFSELVLTYGRPSKKCKDFMKNFPKHFDPIFGVAVVKLRFHVAVAVAVAVAVGQKTARRGMGESDFLETSSGFIQFLEDTFIMSCVSFLASQIETKSYFWMFKRIFFLFFFTVSALY